MVSDSSKDQLTSAPFNFDDVKLTVSVTKVLRTADDVNEQMKSQLEFLIDNPNYWWLGSIDACFNKREVDDGLFYKEMASPQHQALTLHYWVGYFGGNPRGYVLIRENDTWKVLIENCDTDFIWRNEGPTPKSFMKQVKMAAYGDKYREEDDD